MSATITKRRFQFVEDRSDKFYEVTVNGKEVLVRWGRSGTTGQSQTKTFADEVKAAKNADSLIKQKLRKGYVELT